MSRRGQSERGIGRGVEDAGGDVADVCECAGRELDGDVIVRGGENISPGEIEDVLRMHPDVADVAVVGVPSQEWGEEIAAVIVARPDTKPDPDELAAFVRERLRSTKQPTTIRIMEELPYNETGKLLRRVVRQVLTSTD